MRRGPIGFSPQRVPACLRSLRWNGSRSGIASDPLSVNLWRRATFSHCQLALSGDAELRRRSRLIAPLVPSGTEIDFENGETFLSVVGFLFLDTRLVGVPITLHRDFEEVNSRFYVRRKSADTWRRGVVFIRELVPRRAIALVARSFYAENYVAVPMRHEIEHLDGSVKVEYSWRRGRKWESLKIYAAGKSQPIPAGSHAEFITEHYWGYTALRSGCSEYRMEHPRWKIWDAIRFAFEADVAALYGEQFAEVLKCVASLRVHPPTAHRLPSKSARFVCSGGLWPAGLKVSIVAV